MTCRELTCWVLLALLALVGSHALAQKIQSGFDPNYQFTALKTFAFAPLPAEDPLNARPDLAQRIRTDLRTQLNSIGLREDDAHPDFLVAYSASKQTATSTYSTQATKWSGGESFSQEYTVGTLVTDFIDPTTQRVFWHGTASETVYAGTLQKYVPKGVRKLVEAFQKNRDQQSK